MVGCLSKRGGTPLLRESTLSKKQAGTTGASGYPSTRARCPGILEKCMVDTERGFEAQPTSYEKRVKHLGGDEFHLVKRLTITQPAGKEG